MDGTGKLDAMELIRFLNGLKECYREFSDLEDCEKTANSIIDIIELSQELSELLNRKDQIDIDEFVADFRGIISHISYHILDSKPMHSLFLDEQACFFAENDRTP